MTEIEYAIQKVRGSDKTAGVTDSMMNMLASPHFAPGMYGALAGAGYAPEDESALLHGALGSAGAMGGAAGGDALAHLLLQSSGLDKNLLVSALAHGVGRSAGMVGGRRAGSAAASAVHRVAGKGHDEKKNDGEKKAVLEKFAAIRAPKDFGANLVDELIQGARDNGFGRPVNIQFQGLSPLHTAKIAGQLQALAEADYTLKEASDYLAIPTETLLQVIEAAR